MVVIQKAANLGLKICWLPAIYFHCSSPLLLILCTLVTFGSLNKRAIAKWGTGDPLYVCKIFEETNLFL